MKRINHRRGFTLIELITVMAVSAILLTIITIPVVQGFNLTRAAEGFSSAQRAGRSIIAQIEREVSNAALVRDNSGQNGAITIFVPDSAGVQVPMTLEGVKLDYFKPAEGDPNLRGPGGGFINPDTGKEDPTLRNSKGQVNLPATPGLTMVRYWIGLRDPFTPYNNPYVPFRVPAGKWAVGTGGQDNLYVLYRAEVATKVWSPGAGAFVNNDAFFDPNPTNGQPILDDPMFFTVDPNVALTPQRRARIGNWRKVAKIMTEVSRFDMIRPEFNKQTDQLLLAGTRPRIVPLIRFQPRLVTAESSQMLPAVAPGNETDNGVKVGTESFRTETNGWKLFGATIQPSIMPTVYGPLNASIGQLRSPWTVGNTYFTSDTDGNIFVVPGVGVPQQVFDAIAYNQYKPLQQQGNANYPFTMAAGQAGSSPASRTTDFLPILFDSRAGVATSSFDIREVGNTANRGVPYQYRVPTTTVNENPASGYGIHVGPSTVYNSDLLSGDWGTFTWSDFDQANVGINRRFNKLWDLLPFAIPGIDNPRGKFAKRFIDLSLIPQHGEPSPLDRRNAPVGNGPGFNRVQIVPGSEVIIGPDQKPGPNYGKYVRYTRTNQRPVGPNQYYINYVDQKEPRWEDFGFAGVSYHPRDVNPTNLLSAVLQAQYRAGYVEFDSNLAEPIPTADLNGNPTGNIYVTYRFQFTEPADVVSIDYGSSKNMEIFLTVQNYPQSNIKNPQSITLKGSAAVRNMLR